MAKNGNLHSAKREKNDEFYTQYEDIQKELNHYEQHFKGKTVMCNCDDPFESNFSKFFLRNFNYLGLKRLICTSYAKSLVAGTERQIKDADDVPVSAGHGYVMDITEVPMANGRGVSDDDIDELLHSEKRGVKRLIGDGDFASDECIEYMKQADIIVTNPPFSEFRKYVELLMEYEKKFIIIGSKNAITYKEFFPLLKDDKVWIGFTNVKSFKQPDGTFKNFGNIGWFTNLDISKRHEELDLFCRYYGHEEDYPKYDNYDAINVDKVSEIPVDYEGIMGVPITFMDKYNPEQFEIIGYGSGSFGIDIGVTGYKEQYKSMLGNTVPVTGNLYYVKNGMPVTPYKRFLIRRKVR